MSRERRTLIAEIGTPAAARIRRATVRAMLLVASLDAAALLIASVSGADGEHMAIRHVLVGLAFVALNAIPLVTRRDLTALVLTHRRLLLPLALISGALLWLDGPTRSLYLPAAMTPVGVAAMFGFRREGVLSAALVLAGYLTAAPQSSFASGSVELLLSDVVTVGALLFATLATVRVGMRASERAGATIDRLRADPDLARRPAPAGSPGAWARAQTPAAERHARIQVEVRRLLQQGKQYKTIRHELQADHGLVLSDDDVRYQVRKLRAETAAELGVPTLTTLQLVDYLRERAAQPPVQDEA
ncbi:MAG TPA: hypothetical protein VN635_08300 [Conexibacter sp.]|nr:hypothetical protein [Conexibacter sp.]